MKAKGNSDCVPTRVRSDLVLDDKAAIEVDLVVDVVAIPVGEADETMQRESVPCDPAPNQGKITGIPPRIGWPFANADWGATEHRPLAVGLPRPCVCAVIEDRVVAFSRVRLDSSQSILGDLVIHADPSPSMGFGEHVRRPGGCPGRILFTSSFRSSCRGCDLLPCVAPIAKGGPT